MLVVGYYCGFDWGVGLFPLMPSRVDFTKALRVDKVCPLWLVLCPVGGKGQSERSVREPHEWFLFGYGGGRS